MQIINGLHQIKTSMLRPHLPYVMCYVFEDHSGKITLFDTGFGTDTAFEELKNGLHDIGYQILDIENIIISHSHPDHMGMLDRIREVNPNFNLIMSKKEYNWLITRQNRDWQSLGNQWLQKHGMSIDEINNSKQDLQWKNVEWPQLKNPTLVNDLDNLIFGEWDFQFLDTPGHTIGHLCVYEENKKIMLTGDHVLPHISPNVSVDFEGKNNESLIQYIDSLEKIKNYKTNIVLPAHEFGFKNLKQRIDELLIHHQERLKEHLILFEDQPMTAIDVARQITWNTGSFDNFNLMMKRSAVGETIAHLEYLVAKNSLEKINGGHKQVVWSLP
tara:strand:+ start:98 stop:1084 length:987 start_codon:yes stop_codon:yes gene_type:complete